MPGHHVSVFVLPTTISLPYGGFVPVAGFRYLVSTPAQSFDTYEVREQVSPNILPVVGAPRIGTDFREFVGLSAAAAAAAAAAAGCC